MTRWVTFAVLVVLLVPGCADKTATPQSEPGRRAVVAGGSTEPGAEQVVRIQNGTSLHVLFLGTGWGRMEIVADEALTLRVNLSHDKIQNLNLFSREGNGIYDVHNHTNIYLYAEDGTPVGQNTYSFTWWGSPTMAWWPSNSADQARDTVTLEAGKAAILIVATTVPGYRISLDSGKQDIQRAADLKLGPRAGYEVIVPSPTETTTFSQDVGHVQRVREWSSGERTIGPSLLLMQYWDEGRAPSVAVGVEQEQRGFTRPAPAPGLPLPILETNLASNGGGGRGTSTSSQLQGGTFDMFYTLTQSYAGIESNDRGGAFMMIPVDVAH